MKKKRNYKLPFEGKSRERNCKRQGEERREVSLILETGWRGGVRE